MQKTVAKFLVFLQLFAVSISLLHFLKVEVIYLDLTPILNLTQNTMKEPKNEQKLTSNAQNHSRKDLLLPHEIVKIIICCCILHKSLLPEKIFVLMDIDLKAISNGKIYHSQ